MIGALNIGSASVSTSASLTLLAPTIGLEPFSGMQEAAHESVTEQHVSHWLRDDDINHVRAADLLHLPLQDPDPLGQTVTVDQDLCRRQKACAALPREP